METIIIAIITIVITQPIGINPMAMMQTPWFWL
jgi:hypothetical protein